MKAPRSDSLQLGLQKPTHLAMVMAFLLLAASCKTTQGTAHTPVETLAGPRPIAVELGEIARGLDTPWAIAFGPDGRIFVTERPGRIRVIANGVLQPEPWITLEVIETAEGGLMGLALDPDFTNNHFAYVAHTYRAEDGSLQNRLVRLQEDAVAGKGVLDKVLHGGVAGATNHDGGRVKVGPDGKLYWTTGDSQEPSLAQNLSSPNGKILRLNRDGTIPPDNPFPGSPVYSYGHRNAQGLAWQPGTGHLYATEHGPSSPLDCCRDEVNYIEPGKNYGWPVIRGAETRQGMEPPVFGSGPDETWAPGGATFVTQGPWAGSLLFTGLRGQALYRLTLDPSDSHRAVFFERLFERRYGRLRDAVEGPDGAIYVLTSNRDGRGDPSEDDDRVLRVTVR